MQRVLVVGGSGFVGRRLVELLGPDRAIGTWATKPVDGFVHFDVTSQRLADILSDLPSSVSHVFIPFGVVNPELCAREPEETARTNVAGVISVLADTLAAGLVPTFLSTDYVFDGSRGGRTEDEPQCPTTEYGRQKAAVERWLQAREEPWTIARLSKVVSGDTTIHSVLGQWVNDLRDGKPMRSATDQIFSPAFVDDIGRALIDLADIGARGVYHVAGDEPLSRFDLNRMLVEAVQRVDASVPGSVEPCSLRDVPFRELRPLNTSLSTEKLRATLPWRFRSMQDLVAEIARDAFGRPSGTPAVTGS